MGAICSAGINIPMTMTFTTGKFHNLRLALQTEIKDREIKLLGNRKKRKKERKRVGKKKPFFNYWDMFSQSRETNELNKKYRLYKQFEHW